MSSKPLPKPLSERTLQKRYAALAESSHGRIDITTDSGKRISTMLHRYFAAFSNLYGMIPLRGAWELFCELEPELTGQKKLLKKDFLAFSDILRIEAQPYYILNEDDIWPEDGSSKPIDRILVNKKLVGRGYYRFHDLLVVIESQNAKPFLLLNKKEDYLMWAKPDAFRKTPCAQDMLHFLEELRVARDSQNLDVNGRPIHGKTLNRVIFWHRDEQSSYEYTSLKWEKEAIAAESNQRESEKLMRKIERNIHLGDPLIPMTFFLHVLVDDLEEVGVHLSESKLDKLIQLYTNLNNKSRLWCNCGWTPEEMAKMRQPQKPPSISFGPGLQSAFANGELSREDLERMVRETGFSVAKN